MDIVSILGLGAIGLGFLLAYLTYRLLATERKNNTPIYVYQFFCFALVLIGAWLQSASSFDSQKVKDLLRKNSEVQEELTVFKKSSHDLQKQIRTVKNELDSAKREIKLLSEKLTDSQMISNKVPRLEIELKSIESQLNMARRNADQLAKKYTSTLTIMKKISKMVPGSIQNLHTVNAVLTGNSCSGGSHGVPLWGGKGTEMAKLSTNVISNLAAAKSSIDSIMAQE